MGTDGFRLLPFSDASFPFIIREWRYRWVDYLTGMLDAE